jgi:hypothetical protein
MKSSYNLKEPPGAGSQVGQRIKVTKRSEGMSGEGEEYKSTNWAELLEQERATSQMYKEKYEHNMAKCRFLTNKLTALGSLEGVPEMMAAEVSEMDIKIKELELQLHFKRGQQLKKLRKKVGVFLEQINFEVPAEDMEKIEDEIEIILFLIDIFEEKFNEMTAERKEINELIAKLEDSSSVVGDSDTYRKENEMLMEKLAALEEELERIKHEDLQRLEPNLVPKESVRPGSKESLKQSAKESLKFNAKDSIKHTDSDRLLAVRV